MKLKGALKYECNLKTSIWLFYHRCKCQFFRYISFSILTLSRICMFRLYSYIYYRIEVSAELRYVDSFARFYVILWVLLSSLSWYFYHPRYTFANIRRNFTEASFGTEINLFEFLNLSIRNYKDSSDINYHLFHKASLVCLS